MPSGARTSPWVPPLDGSRDESLGNDGGGDVGVHRQIAVFEPLGLSAGSIHQNWR